MLIKVYFSMKFANFYFPRKRFSFFVIIHLPMIVTGSY